MTAKIAPKGVIPRRPIALPMHFHCDELASRPRGALSTSCVASLAILLLIVCGCSDPSLIGTTDVKSPDGEIILRLVEDRNGGAAVAGSMTVYVLPSNAPASRKKMIFEGSAMGMGKFGNFSATWRGERLIELSHTGGYVVECHTTAELSADLKVSVLGCNS